MITVRKKYLKTIVVTKPLLSVVSAVTLRRGSAHNDTCTVHQIKKKKRISIVRGAVSVNRSKQI